MLLYDSHILTIYKHFMALELHFYSKKKKKIPRTKLQREYKNLFYPRMMKTMNKSEHISEYSI